MNETELNKIKTVLILKYGGLQLLLHEWALSDNDFLSDDEKQVLIDYCDGMYNITDVKSLNEMRNRNLCIKHGIYQ